MREKEQPKEKQRQRERDSYQRKAENPKAGDLPGERVEERRSEGLGLGFKIFSLFVCAFIG